MPRTVDSSTTPGEDPRAADTSRRVLVIGHDHVAGLGHVGAELSRRGVLLEHMTVVPEGRFDRPDVDVAFPDPSGWGGIVTTGAPWPRHETASWWPCEIDLLRRAHTIGVPILGICFGAQLLAQALGGGVSQVGADRIGWFTVESRHAKVDAGPWFQWHAEQLIPPPGATILATSPDGCEGFALGRSVGVQFHPEMNAELLDRWLSLPGTNRTRFAALTVETSAQDTPALWTRVGRFVDLLDFPVAAR